MKKAVLLVGHGSRRAEANEALVYLADLLKKKRPETEMSYGYLQFAQPDLPAALEALDKKGIEEVAVVPVFLYEGIHIREDIPEVLAEEQKKRPHMRLVQAPVLGIDERMAEIVLDRVDQGLRG
ncbi:sirohydrochlorin chelatase [Dethiobacter alkaliphilus]|uniref:sirohydrochlorin chelatase n=1 Tax=Dethiobacter alkaliphilus TaxID=427926 RepID=UPI00222690A0|nr:CbiX/SirB N-terminal domain-containing protein [Dethiobacter alkaliphilus]MCW3491483.1 CbiX/SirB N-terminal domain-containing protein [Dethiobacter alkaliphilus]